MNLTALAKTAEKMIIDNSPAILTALGVTGALTTAYLTGTASFKAAKLIEVEQTILDGVVTPATQMGHVTHQLDTWEKTQMVWKFYIPAASFGVLTVAAIIGSNRIGNRRAAALAAAYTLSEKAFSEYKEKVVERIGIAKESKIREEISQRHVNEHQQREVIITGGGDVLCYELFTGRYFHSDMETLKKAMNDTNYQVLNDMYASLSDFYNRVGLPTTSYSDEVGWNSDKMLELEFSTVLSDDQRPCIAVNFQVAPVRDYFRLR